MKIYKKGGKIFGRYNEKTGILYKDNLKNKHLLWSKGGVPAIDADMYDGIKPVKAVWCETDKGKIFYISGENFERYKEEINHPPFGKQYVVDIEHWTTKHKDNLITKLK